MTCYHFNIELMVELLRQPTSSRTRNAIARATQVNLIDISASKALQPWDLKKQLATNKLFYIKAAPNSKLASLYPTSIQLLQIDSDYTLSLQILSPLKKSIHSHPRGSKTLARFISHPSSILEVDLFISCYADVSLTVFQEHNTPILKANIAASSLTVSLKPITLAI